MGINYKFIAAGLLLFGACVVWLCSYQAISGLIYARGKSRVLIAIVQAALIGGGFVLLITSKGTLTIFGYQLSAVQYGYIALGFGLLLGATSRPAPEEISAVQDQ